MTGNKSLLSEFEEKAGTMVSYGDDNVGKTLGYGIIIIGNVIISNIALVDGLKHNLLSISQIIDRGFYVMFYDTHYEVVHTITRKTILKAYRQGNIYEAKLYANTNGPETCLVTKALVDESWNWHKKLSHLNFKNVRSKCVYRRGVEYKLYLLIEFSVE